MQSKIDFYEKFFTPHTSQYNDDFRAVLHVFEREQHDLVSAIVLLGEYYKRKIYWAKACEKYSRFFAGYWNRKNINAVHQVLTKYDPGALGSENYNHWHDKNIKDLLTDLNQSLIEAKNLVNPQGELAQRIDFLQKRFNLHIINITEINRAIQTSLADEASPIKQHGSEFSLVKSG